MQDLGMFPAVETENDYEINSLCDDGRVRYQSMAHLQTEGRPQANLGDAVQASSCGLKRYFLRT